MRNPSMTFQTNLQNKIGGHQVLTDEEITGLTRRNLVPNNFCHQRWGVSWHKPSNILCCITKFTPVSFDTIDNRIVILKWVLFKTHLEMYYIEISLQSVSQITICWIKMCSVQQVSRMYYIERSLQSICQKTGQKSTRQSKFKFPRYLLIILWRNK